MTRDMMPDRTLSGDVRSVTGCEREAATRLQALGFRVLREGPWTTVDGPSSLWQRTFNLTLARRTMRQMDAAPLPEIDFDVPVGDVIAVPQSLADVIEEVVLARPPQFF